MRIKKVEAESNCPGIATLSSIRAMPYK